MFECPGHGDVEQVGGPLPVVGSQDCVELVGGPDVVGASTAAAFGSSGGTESASSAAAKPPSGVTSSVTRKSAVDSDDPPDRVGVSHAPQVGEHHQEQRVVVQHLLEVGISQAASTL